MKANNNFDYMDAWQKISLLCASVYSHLTDKKLSIEKSNVMCTLFMAATESQLGRAMLGLLCQSDMKSTFSELQKRRSQAPAMATKTASHSFLAKHLCNLFYKHITYYFFKNRNFLNDLAMSNIGDTSIKKLYHALFSLDNNIRIIYNI